MARSGIASASVVVGRDEELKLVEDRLIAAGNTQGSVVLISGEPGIGKTRLLREVVDRNRSTPCIAVLGQCYEFLQSPLGAFVDILNDLRERNKLGLSAASGVKQVMDELVESAVSEPAAQELDKRKLFRAIRKAFDIYSREHPLLLCMDDLQWADSASLDLLQYLADHLAQSRLVIVATYRSSGDEQSDRFRRTLGYLARGTSAYTRELRPLATETIRNLLRNASTNATAEETRRIAVVAEHADGNPLLAEELFKTTGSIDMPSSETIPLPVSVRATTLFRLASLAPRDRKIITCASAIGRSFTSELLAQIAQQQNSDVLAALRQASQIDLVEPDADRKLLRFRHELVRRAIYDDLLPDEARALHKRIATVLESAPESPQRITELAYHYWMTSETVKAADFNEQSGDRAFRLCSYTVAAENYERALRSLGGDNAAREAAIRERLGNAYYQLGQGEAAQAAFLAARSYHESRREPEPVARLSVKLATLFWSEGRESDAAAECKAALGLVGKDSASYFRAHSYLGHFLVDRDGENALEHFRLADLYTGVREQDDSMVFHQCRALALGQRGDADGMAADLRSAYDIAREQGDLSLAVRCLGNLGLKLADLGARKKALDAFAEATELMEEEQLWDLDCAVCTRQNAWAQLQFGDLESARTLIHRALEYPTDSLRLRAFAAQSTILIGLRTMDDNLDRRFTDPGELDSILAPGNEALYITALAFAEREIALGRAPEGSALIHRVVEAYGAVPLARDDDGVFVLAALHGSDDDAKAARAFVARYASDTHAEVASAHLLLYDAAMARRSGEQEQAAALAESARQLYAKLGWRWHVARGLEIGGKLKEAMHAFEETGDVRSARRLYEILNPVNRRGRTKSELTEREQEIATLAAAGRSTKEIAEALTLSPRTIETHLASIFAKLSVRNRAELIAKWRDLPGAAQASP